MRRTTFLINGVLHNRDAERTAKKKINYEKRKQIKLYELGRKFGVGDGLLDGDGICVVLQEDDEVLEEL